MLKERFDLYVFNPFTGGSSTTTRNSELVERIAVDSYREIATYFAGFDSTTRKMIEEIQAEEEEHADDLADLLEGPAQDGR